MRCKYWCRCSYGHIGCPGAHMLSHVLAGGPPIQTSQLSRSSTLQTGCPPTYEELLVVADEHHGDAAHDGAHPHGPDGVVHGIAGHPGQRGEQSCSSGGASIVWVTWKRGAAHASQVRTAASRIRATLILRARVSRENWLRSLHTAHRASSPSSAG